MKSDSITLAPAGKADKPQPQDQAKDRKSESGGTRTFHPDAAAFTCQTMATNPTGQFFGFEEKCPAGPQNSKINEDPLLQQL